MFKSNLKGNAAQERARLRDALKARDAAEVQISEARAAVEHARTPISAAHQADNDAKRARADAEAARKAWTGDLNTAGTHRRLEIAAATAERTAEELWRATEGAEAAIQAAQQTVYQAEGTLNHLNAEIVSAISAILLSEVEPHLASLERAAHEYNAALLPVKALLRVFDPSRVGWRDPSFKDVADSEATAIVREALARSAIRQFTEVEMVNGFDKSGSSTPDDLQQISRAWHERARTLRANPDA